jgi:hypothetical protein
MQFFDNERSSIIITTNMKHFIHYISFTILLAAAGNLYAQTPVYFLGPMAGINLISHSTPKMSSIQSEPGCFQFQDGSSIQPMYGVDLHFSLDERMHHYLIVNGLFNSMTADLNAINGASVSVPVKINGVEGPGSVSTSMRVMLSYFSVAVGYKYNFLASPEPSGPSVALMVDVGAANAQQIKKTVSVHTPLLASGVTASNTSDIADIKKLRAGFRAEVLYDIPITVKRQWVLSPLVGIDVPFTSVTNSSAIDMTTQTVKSWMVSAIYIGLSVRTQIGSYIMDVL